MAGSGGGGDAEAVADAKREAEAARVRTQCAIVLAYGALCDAILEDSRKKRKSAGTAISDFVGEHIMPSLDPAGQLIMFPDWRIEQNPMLAANALWSLVRFAEHLPSPKVASTSLNCAALMLNHTDD